MTQNTFITGATGFLGSYLAKELLLNTDAQLYLLARPKKDLSAEQRVQEVLQNLLKKQYSENLCKRIHVVEGDVAQKNLGIKKSVYEALCKNINSIYHAAAIAEFRVPLNIIRKTNVVGTENVLKLAQKCKNLDKVNHISTVFVAGTHQGEFSEDDLDVGQKFNNTYEQTKFEAELKVEEYRKKGLNILKMRIGVIAGSYETGETTSFKMLYGPLHIFSLEILKEIPIDEDAKFNIIPVDIAVQAIRVLGSQNVRNKNFHLMSNESVSLTQVFIQASDYFGYKNPKLVPPKEFQFDALSAVQKQILAPYVPYFKNKRIFRAEATKRVLNSLGFKYLIIDQDFLLRVFEFCKQIGFIHVKPKLLVK